MNKKIHKYLPKYAVIPLLSVLIVNVITYNVSKIITNSFVHYNISSFFDDFFPFFPLFIIIYILSYVQWIVCFILLAKENKDFCYRFLSAEIIAKLCCLFFFFVFPTTMVRPEITGNSIFENLTKLVYYFDQPVNLFPSIHCLESWLLFRCSLSMKRMPEWYKYVMFVCAILVFLSTVLVKQHVFWDILGGIFVVEVGIVVAKRFKTERIFKRINKCFGIV